MFEKKVKETKEVTKKKIKKAPEKKGILGIVLVPLLPSASILSRMKRRLRPTMALGRCSRQ